MKTLKLSSQQGLTLVELMIALTLGLLIIGGLMTMFISSRQSFNTNSTLSSIQESGRFAIGLLKEELLNAGYRGLCIATTTNHVANNTNASIWLHDDTSIKGWHNTQPAFLSSTIANNTDAIFVQYAGAGQTFSGSLSNITTQKTIELGDSGSYEFQNNVSALISDGLGCDLFIGEASGSTIKKTSNTPWSHSYNSRFEVLSMQRVMFFIADSAGIPTLHKATFDDSLNAIAIEPMIPNVSGLTFSYGILTNNEITDFKTADQITNWQQVVAVKIAADITSSDNQTKQFNALVSLRNRLK